MKEDEFKNLLEDLSREANEFILTSYEKEYFWQKYQIMLEERWTSKKADLAYSATELNEEELRIYRHQIANNGVELTPRQLKIFITTLEIILCMHECQNNA